MNVFFDYELLDDVRRDLNLTTIGALEKIRSFMIERLAHIREELEQEEKERRAYLVILTLDRSFKVQYIDYSTEMVSKINNCFPPDKRDELNIMLATLIQILNN